jgi:hypothetical protein
MMMNLTVAFVLMWSSDVIEQGGSLVNYKKCGDIYNMDDHGLTKTWKGSGLHQQHWDPYLKMSILRNNWATWHMDEDWHKCKCHLSAVLSVVLKNPSREKWQLECTSLTAVVATSMKLERKIDPSNSTFYFVNVITLFFLPHHCDTDPDIAFVFASQFSYT